MKNEKIEIKKRIITEGTIGEGSFESDSIFIEEYALINGEVFERSLFTDSGCLTVEVSYEEVLEIPRMSQYIRMSRIGKEEERTRSYGWQAFNPKVHLENVFDDEEKLVKDDIEKMLEKIKKERKEELKNAPTIPFITSAKQLFEESKEQLKGQVQALDDLEYDVKQ